MKRDFGNLKKFMEDPAYNTKDFIEFFEFHSQYWKRQVFLDLLDYYYATADYMAEKLTGAKPE